VLFIRNGDVTAEGYTIQSLSISDAASINSSGNLALIATVTGPGGTGQAVLGVDRAAGGTFLRRKFNASTPVSNRTFLNAWRRSDGSIGARNLVPGPVSFIYTWDYGSAGIPLAASTPNGPFDFVQTPSFSKNGSYYSFVGSLSGIVGLYVQATGSPHNQVTNLSGGSFRPMTADNGNTVFRPTTSTIALWRTAGGLATISPGSFTNAGSPGITQDGAVIAFSGNEASVAGLYTYLATPIATPNVPQRFATPSVMDTTVDPFEFWRCAGVNCNGAWPIEQPEVHGGIATFDGFNRIGISQLDRPLGKVTIVSFLGTDTNSIGGVYYARLDNNSGRVFGTARIAKAGDPISGITPTSFSLFDPINDKGQIAYLGTDGTNSGIFRHEATGFTKYKQFVNVNSDTTALAANDSTRWFDRVINPNVAAPNQVKMEKGGCTLSALATIAGIFGKEMTPLEMRNLFIDLDAFYKYKDPVGNQIFTNLAKVQNVKVRVTLPTGVPRTLRWAGQGGSFNSIVNELSADRPVLLAVPSQGRTGVAVKCTTTNPPCNPVELPPLPNGNLRANSERHYIVAYGLNPYLNQGDPVTASDIFISDPGHSSYYANLSKYQSVYSAGEELVNITLKDYFDLINTSPNYDFKTAEVWFNTSTFDRRVDDRIVEAHADDKARQIQRFETIDGADGVSAPRPEVDVHSPVELVITVNGQRYVSTPALALPGDIVLTRSGIDAVADLDPVNEVGIGENEPTELFPPYYLSLPPNLAASDLDFEIHGVGDGPYSISFYPGADGISATNTLEGTITNGQVVVGTIQVVVAPSPTPTAGGTPSISGSITYGNAIGNPAQPRFVKNVSVASTVGTPMVGPVITGTPGTYTLTGFGAGSYTIKPTKPAGPNSAISSLDAARISQGVSGAVDFVTSNQKFAADVSGNGSVSSLDAAKIAQFVAGVTPLPPPNFTSEWRFFTADIPGPPSAPLPTPPYNDSRTYASVSSNVTGEDYIALLLGDVSGNYNPATHPRPAAGPERGIEVELPQFSASTDKEIVVPVNVQGIVGKNVISYEFDLQYDPSVIQPVADVAEVKGTASRGLSVVTNAAEPGLLRVVVYGPIPIDENGVLLNLRFTAVGKPDSISSLTFDRIMFNEGEPVTPTNGEVRIEN